MYTLLSSVVLPPPRAAPSSQHNIPHTSDRQNETAVTLNMVVDAAAKHSATAVGMDETVSESLVVTWRRLAHPDPYFFSIGSMTILGETRAAAAAAVGDRLMAAVARRPNTHFGFMVHLLVSGCIARRATAVARKRLSDAAFALAIRAAL